ncbi:MULTISPECIES: phosphate ABC transporter ATP-binding protein PstB [Limnochorda]|uniref:phosphate ABC transporter ATP-binding protein PstB n=1 Tax=Limnochorda TaxID=1676651 RepID=UPI001DD7C33E|nr:phosphate ABC transporter ATP-binding protein PstB [Limnochorda pilosa]MBO2486814.1 phosphate ABC transporter ATP-binding protein [Bacillota bacterium]MBO2519326.1 phosphate ABC transporter ATP-binding protein [Bacillota bacterium]
MAVPIRVEHLNAAFGPFQALHDVTLTLPARQVTAIIGPSGCGKSTFVRCINRMHEETPGGRVWGQIYLGDEPVYGPDVDPVVIRRRVGMVFQRPTPFPTMSILENVVAGYTLLPGRPRDLESLAERSLRQAGLWDEVKDRLRDSPLNLSGGQQQRLCIARALAVEPEVILLDEPCSSLDPISTAKVEETIMELAQRYTVVLVTHNIQQATRVSQHTAFFLLGRLIEFGPTEQLFTNPANEQTEAYITGRFG